MSTKPFFLKYFCNLEFTIKIFKDRFGLLSPYILLLLIAQSTAATTITAYGSLQQPKLKIKAMEYTIPLPHEYGIPVTMTKGDFDGDGSVDVMIGFSKGDKGSLLLLRGGLLAQYPRWNELSGYQRVQHVNKLFSKPQKSLQLNFNPELMFSGDFDADGLLDIAFAKIGSESIFYAASQGSGKFEEVIEKKLSGEIINIAIGEWGRPDGLADFLIEIKSDVNTGIQILQGAKGAAMAEPRSLNQNTNLSLDQLITQMTASKANKKVQSIHPPNVPTTYDENQFVLANSSKLQQQAKARLKYWLPANLTQVTVQSDLPKMLENDGIASLSMRLSMDAIADTIILESEPKAQLKILLGLPVATITVNSIGDDNNRDGAITLREAIMLAEGSLDSATLDVSELAQIVGTPAAAQLDQINFDITGAAPYVINILSELPTMSDSIVIDGTSEPDFVDTPIVNIDGSLDNTGGSGISALRVAGGNSTIRGLIINNLLLGTLGGSGIVLTNSGNNIIEGNFIGTDPTGTMDMGNGGNGVQIVNSANNLIGGSTGVAVRNIISGMGYGAITIEGASSTGNRVEGNYLGTDVTGTIIIGNDSNNIGINNGASQNIIGGLIDGTENVISGNLTLSFPNIIISRGGTGNPDPTANVFQGNYIGTDITGTLGLGNASVGVFMTGGANNNQVGGAAVGAGNVISSSGLDGIRLAGSAYSNFVSGNWIGTDITGTANLGNSSHGVFLQQLNFGAGGTIIGGTQLGAGNIIAYNGGDGVFIDNGSGSKIQGNYIFSNADLAIDLCESFNTTTQGCDDLVSVTVNDDGDADSGANDLLNLPVLNKVLNDMSNTNTLFSGSYNGLADAVIDIELFSNSTCDSSGFGEAENPLGITQITTDASGNANFSISLSTSSLQNTFITASASDVTNNTSELSACAKVLAEVVFMGGFE